MLESVAEVLEPMAELTAQRISGRPSTQKHKDVRVVFLVSEDLDARIRSAAEARDESIGSWIRRACELALSLAKNAKISSADAVNTSDGATR